MSAARPSAKAAARLATRTALLQAATEMLAQAPAADPIAALRPVDISRRAVPPRSTGAFYNIWPTQADFRRDLLRHVLSVDRYAVGDRTTSVLAALLADEDCSLEEMFRISASLSFEGLMTEAAMRTKQAMWSAHSQDAEVRELLAMLYTSVGDAMIPLYRAMLERSGRRMREPHTVAELAVVLSALMEGLYLRRAVQPEAVPDVPLPVPAPDEAPADRRAEQPAWSLFASSAYLIFMSMSEPA